MKKDEFRMNLDGLLIAFSIYHPGANSKRNCTKEEQSNDWKRIADFYKQA